MRIGVSRSKLFSGRNLNGCEGIGAIEIRFRGTDFVIGGRRARRGSADLTTAVLTFFSIVEGIRSDVSAIIPAGIRGAGRADITSVRRDGPRGCE